MQEYRYYLRDNESKPVITVVLLKDGDSVARGIAICSKLDNPCKKAGYNRAKGRAVKAMQRKESCEPIIREEAIDVLFSTLDEYDQLYPKCHFDPDLYPYERRLLGLQQD